MTLTSPATPRVCAIGESSGCVRLEAMKEDGREVAPPLTFCALCVSRVIELRRHESR